MSERTRNFQPNTGIRRSLRQMTVPVAIAYVIVTLLTFALRIVTFASALVADVAERMADAGDIARAAARGPVLITTARTAGGAA
jgi:hypothetical protein